MPRKVWIVLLQLLALWVILIDSFNFVHNPECMQNCSWISYDEDGLPVTSGCTFCISEEYIDAFSSCPNPLEPVDDFLTVVEDVDVTFYSIPKNDEVTSLCANITFKVQRGHEADLKAIRITAEPTTHLDVGSVLCQLWKFTAPLDRCSLTTERCSSDVGRERQFHYDCFCGFGPGPGLLNVSVDALPKTKRQHQSFIEFPIPNCSSPLLKNNEYCKLPVKDQWRPLHVSYTQLCDYDSVNVTFDTLDWSEGVSSYYILLYEADFMNCSISPESSMYVSATKVDMMTADISEKIISNWTVNFTTVTITGLRERGLDKQYIMGFRIRESTLKRICPPVMKLKDDPCKSSPCSSGEACMSDCWDYTCNCTQDLLRIKNRCRAPWYPVNYSYQSLYDSVVISFSAAAPPEYNITRYRVVLLPNITETHLDPSTTVLNDDGSINATFDHVIPSQSYTPAIRIHEEECPDCVFQYYDSFRFVPQLRGHGWMTTHTLLTAFVGSFLIILVIVGVLFPRQKQAKSNRPSVNSSAMLSGVRLICNPNSQLQDFCDHLRRLLRVHIKCPVAIHTVLDPGQVMTSQWLATARSKRETLCFLWDENLAILVPSHDRYGSCDRSPDSWAGCTVSKTMVHLLDSDLDHSRLLLFDFAAPKGSSFPNCPRFLLPSGLSDFLQGLDPGIDQRKVERSAILAAYAGIKGLARMNVRERSLMLWEQMPQESADMSVIVLESDSDEEIPLDEEEPDDSIIEASTCLELWNSGNRDVIV